MKNATKKAIIRRTKWENKKEKQQQRWRQSRLLYFWLCYRAPSGEGGAVRRWWIRWQWHTKQAVSWGKIEKISFLAFLFLSLWKTLLKSILFFHQSFWLEVHFSVGADDVDDRSLHPGNVGNVCCLQNISERAIGNRQQRKTQKWEKQSKKLFLLCLPELWEVLKHNVAHIAFFVLFLEKEICIKAPCRHRPHRKEKKQRQQSRGPTGNVELAPSS